MSSTASYGHDEDFERIDPEMGVKRGLKTRHLSMMALAGIIGPGICSDESLMGVQQMLIQTQVFWLVLEVRCRTVALLP